MASSLSSLRSIFFRNPARGRYTRQDGAPPFFARAVPWWAKWTWGLIACDIFMTSSAIELTWNRWSKLVTEENGLKHYEQRPLWQRAGVCVAHLGFGVGVACALLVTQIRFVRSMTIIPEGKRLFVQCAHNSKTGGLFFPMNQCTLSPGRNDSEMIMRVKDQLGHWHIDLESAYITGKKVGKGEAQKSILDQWGLESATSKPVSDAGWKRGPIRR